MKVLDEKRLKSLIGATESLKGLLSEFQRIGVLPIDCYIVPEYKGRPNVFLNILVNAENMDKVVFSLCGTEWRDRVIHEDTNTRTNSDGTRSVQRTVKYVTGWGTMILKSFEDVRDNEETA